MKRELLQSLNKCQNKECRDVLEEYEIGKLDVNGIDYDQVIELLKNVFFWAKSQLYT